MKGKLTLHKSPELEPHHLMQFSVILRIPLFFLFLGGGLDSDPSERDTVRTF